LSMSSSMRAQSFILEHGRGLNSASDVYRLPADEEEMERLQKQHLMLRELLGKYPPEFDAVLAEEAPGGETKAVLDLGCGSGGWIMELALNFPHVNCVAVDLVPLQSTAMPPNCRSEVDDVNLGLEHYYGDFNIVHARAVASGVRDYPGFIEHVGRVLRPGGLMYLAEFDFNMYDEDKNMVHVDTSSPGPPWVACWIKFFMEAVEKRGGTSQVPSQLFDWVRQRPELEDVTFHQVWLPASPFKKGDDPESVLLRRIGEQAREDVLAIIKSGRPLLLGHGVSPAVLKELEGNAQKELAEAEVTCYSRIVVVTGRKKPLPP